MLAQAPWWIRCAKYLFKYLLWKFLWLVWWAAWCSSSTLCTVCGISDNSPARVATTTTDKFWTRFYAFLIKGKLLPWKDRTHVWKSAPLTSNVLFTLPWPLIFCSWMFSPEKLKILKCIQWSFGHSIIFPLKFVCIQMVVFVVIFREPRRVAREETAQWSDELLPEVRKAAKY